MNPVITNGSPLPLGASSIENGTNFAIFMEENEEPVTLCLFHSPYHLPFMEIRLDPEKNKTGTIWHVHVTGLTKGIAYGYRKGTGEQTSTVLLDPYASLIASSHLWEEQRQQEYRPLGLVPVPDLFDWEEDTKPNIPPNDLILYEMHVRGFTRHPSSKVAHPGTFQGLIEKIPHLQWLGVNAVELMPVHEFNEEEYRKTNPETNRYLCNYWGYSTVSFFSLMNRYGAGADAYAVKNEFREMVKAFHAAGIEVILDVVFNHTAEGNELGPKFCYSQLGDSTYYIHDNEGKYANYSGCGNTVNSNHPIVRKLIIDSLRYWVTEMHVDGFRFDLASTLTRDSQGVPLSNPPLIEEITQDPVLAGVKLIAEPWDPAGLYQVGGFYPQSQRWSEWNDKYRDTVRRFIKGDGGANEFATRLSGSQDLYWSRGGPQTSINFVTAHDGFSMRDLVSYNRKHNLANGENNRDGINNNESWNCGKEGESHDPALMRLRQRQMRNFFLALLLSQGVPMLLMGDEYGHSRHGNNNAWCQDNDLNWFLWDHFSHDKDLGQFLQFMIAFRKERPLLRRTSFLSPDDVEWHGQLTKDPQWDKDQAFVAFTLKDKEQGHHLFVAFNAHSHPVSVQIPVLAEGQQWHIVVATQQEHFNPKGVSLKENLFSLADYSALVLEASELK